MIIAGDDDTGCPWILADQAPEFGNDLDADAQLLVANPQTMHHTADYHALLPTDTDLRKEWSTQDAL